MCMEIYRRTPRFAVLASFLFVASCSPGGGFKVTPIPSDQSLQERVTYRHPGWVRDRVAVIDVSGVLMNAREVGLLSKGEHVVSHIVEQLQVAASDKRVKAVVLRINSPGGSVTASDILYEEVLAFKKKSGKPVVAFFQDVAASGGYYVACAADEIIAQKTTVTGSIGVVMQMVDLSGAMLKLGISADAIKSGPFKDAGSPLRKLKKDERVIFQTMIDGFYQGFLSVVEAGRPDLTRDEILTLADGRVYTAPQALETGLIDRIDTIHGAVERARALAGIKKSHVVMYRRPLAWAPNLYARSPQSESSTINLLNINLPLDWTRRPKFMYIWDSRD
ncbi:MAG: signal peptide peptidase SppA [Phycisphaerales bacterium]|nr:signal peptide peptidase SppA [Phycisphaerales bacterium]